ncbi:uncharacterized protein V1518DRAFT_414594 [Limtongia smithiae]|uniref:uncharacterized protein n=1 Tax=Limtongia smithiae TaxID=1125753 RepID=UPI0034CD064B
MDDPATPRSRPHLTYKGRHVRRPLFPLAAPHSTPSLNRTPTTPVVSSSSCPPSSPPITSPLIAPTVFLDPEPILGVENVLIQPLVFRICPSVTAPTNAAIITPATLAALTPILPPSPSPSPAAADPPSPPSSIATSQRPSPIPQSSGTAPHKRVVTQTHLALSSRPQRVTCPACGLSYDTYTPDDMRLHATFHARAVGGVEVTIPVDTPPPVCAFDLHVSSGRCLTASIYKFAAKDLMARTRRSLKAAIDSALALCNAELSAPDESVATLASRFSTRASANPTFYICVAPRIDASRNKNSLSSSPDTRKSNAIISIMLVERVTEGHLMSADTGRIVDSPDPIKLVFGVSRIYTAHSARGFGLARRLLDAACSSFVYGLVVPPKSVGWSQPSESGCKVATAWYSEDMTPSEAEADGAHSEVNTTTARTKRKIRVYIER